MARDRAAGPPTVIAALITRQDDFSASGITARVRTGIVPDVERSCRNPLETLLHEAQRLSLNRQSLKPGKEQVSAPSDRVMSSLPRMGRAPGKPTPNAGGIPVIIWAPRRTEATPGARALPAKPW